MTGATPKAWPQAIGSEGFKFGAVPLDLSTWRSIALGAMCQSHLLAKTPSYSTIGMTKSVDLSCSVGIWKTQWSCKWHVHPYALCMIILNQKYHKSQGNSYLELQVDSEGETILVGKLSTSAKRWKRPQPAGMPVAAAAAQTACSKGGSLPSGARLGQLDPLKPSKSKDLICSGLGAGH